MQDLIMNIKNIATLKPVDMYNKDEDKMYISDNGVIIVEFEDNTRRVLDVDNRVDITNYKTWETLINEDSKMDYIFKGDIEYYN